MGSDQEVERVVGISIKASGTLRALLQAQAIERKIL